MSYSFVITVKDGKLEVPEKVFHVPDGNFSLSGHLDDDGSNESLNIQRRNPDGTVTVMLNGWHK